MTWATYPAILGLLELFVPELWANTARGLLKKPIIGSLKSKMAEIRHLENRHDVIFFCRGWSDLDKISETGAE